MDDTKLPAIIATAIAQSIKDAGLAKKGELQSLSEKIQSTGSKVERIESRIASLGCRRDHSARAGHKQAQYTRTERGQRR